MSRLNTRPNNKDKHPGIVDLSPQRRTPVQKKADDAKAMEEKQAREDTHKAGVRQLANVEQRAMQKLKALMTPGPGPRLSETTTRGELATADLGTEAKKNGPPEKKAKARVLPGNGNMKTRETDNEEEKREKGRKTRSEKATYRIEVEEEKNKAAAACEEIDESTRDLPTPHDAQIAKKNFSGPNTVRNVQTWRSKVQSLGATRQVGGSSASNQSYATTIPNTEYTDSAPSPRAHPVTPMGFSNDGVRYRGFDNEANEDLYRDALANLPKRSQRVPSGDIVEVQSSCGNSPANIYGEVDVDSRALDPHYSNDDDSDMDISNSKRSRIGQIRRPVASSVVMDVAVVSEEDHVSVKMENRKPSVGTSSLKGEYSKKVTNKDLPPGSQPAYRRDIIPTIFHWAGGNGVDPFNIDETELVAVLAIIWKHVYGNTVPFDSPPILSLTNQRFSEWRNCFTSAATSAVMSFFSMDDDYLQHDNRVSFASDMKQHYRFLFADCTAADHMEWTGMWRGPLFLQTLAYQFGATASRVPIPNLGSERQGYEGAMAIAAAALERTLTLLVTGEIDIVRVVEDREAMGMKRKRRSGRTFEWKLEQKNGPPQPFSVAVWGQATREFMKVLDEVPPDAMEAIIFEAKAVAERHNPKTLRGTLPSDDVHSERAALAFR